jgi:hypothetical protein
VRSSIRRLDRLAAPSASFADFHHETSVAARGSQPVTDVALCAGPKGRACHGGKGKLAKHRLLRRDDVNAMMAKCVSASYHSGYRKDRFIAVPHWMGFFNRNL